MVLADSEQFTELSEKQQDQRGKHFPRFIVVGGGPVGNRFVHELCKRVTGIKVTVFGDEPYEPYYRFQLSALLTHQHHPTTIEDITAPLPPSNAQQNISYVAQRVASVNVQQQQIVTASGQCYSYDYLVLATGSRAYIPNITGREMDGVYRFRSLRDTEQLLARTLRSRHTVIVGGGLLGLETARALRQSNTLTTVIEQAEHLMYRELDGATSAHLQRYIEQLGIQVVVGDGVRGINGQFGVEDVVLRTGRQIPCDTVVFCTGISANIELARNAGLKVRRGIVVDDNLRTSVSRVYAVGECSEHRGKCYGQVGPGFEQATVLAEFFANGNSRYQGSQQTTRLQVIGTAVSSVGEVAELVDHPKQQVWVYHDPAADCYRKLVLLRGKLVGACGIGDWPEFSRVQEAYCSQRYVYPWQRWRFRLTGRLWNPADEHDICQWPGDAVVCSCQHVSRRDLSDAIKHGCQSPEQLTQQTLAGTVCGACQPMLNSMLTSRSSFKQSLVGWGRRLLNLQ